MAENPDVRIGTAEREQALSNLSQHLSDGRVALPEFDERSAVVSSAVTRGELDSVFTDLPTPSLAPTASRPLDISKSSHQEPTAQPSEPATPIAPSEPATPAVPQEPVVPADPTPDRETPPPNDPPQPQPDET